MNEKEIRKCYIRLAFQYESTIDALLSKGLADMDAAVAAKERFYNALNEEKLQATQKIKDYQPINPYMRQMAYSGMVSLTELSRWLPCSWISLAIEAKMVPASRLSPLREAVRIIEVISIFSSTSFAQMHTSGTLSRTNMYLSGILPHFGGAFLLNYNRGLLLASMLLFRQKIWRRIALI